MDKITYIPKGVCSRQIHLELDGDVIKEVSFVGGCAGNLLGIKSLVEGKTIEEVIQHLDGIQCGVRGTSCPDQLAQALKQTRKRY